ncbi:hypothetical protein CHINAEXTREME_17195 [Halobiforma lacisalsi AJ5]|uniref:Uncharacterized protein n=1 Tax=Natronobacterium lacisalsi AJ5 TaxID=358396 RepID=M0LT57_NATLA|nr:hypothetical protein [Halobiforma lacisalsi]APW99399.1 hypothetical protein CHINAEXTREME_17195 [Halobiforma lacisalsi AJ5]EMA35300.1 hypothetical protein C445_05588 [Halobiforma lacisalsi AJ5]
MSDSIDEIEAAHGQQQNRQPPTDGDGSNSSGFSLGVSKRTLALLGGILFLAAAVYWYGTRSSGQTAGTASDEATDDSENTDEDDVEIDVSADETAAVHKGEIIVPQDPSQPLKGDEAVVQELKKRGRLTGGDD